jgi:hypothetical protein
MVSEKDRLTIEKQLQIMSKPVRLVLFTSDTGCEACPDMLQLVNTIKSKSDKIALETYDLVMDRDKSELYDVKLVPALVVQGGDGKAAKFYGMIEDVLLEILMSTINAVSRGKIWFPHDVERVLTHLTNDVSVRVFLDSDCAECRPVAITALALGLESKLVSTSIFVASDFPELIKRYHITELPKTIFGENLHLDGHVTESVFLEMIFQAEGLKTGPDKKCLVCGTSSPDTICANCKAKIQAEAVNHKLKGEKLRQHETL